jgi:hypothetical protein
LDSCLPKKLRGGGTNPEYMRTGGRENTATHGLLTLGSINHPFRKGPLKKVREERGKQKSPHWIQSVHHLTLTLNVPILGLNNDYNNHIVIVSILFVPGALPLGVKWLGREADHLHLLPRSKNVWSYISTPPIRLHVVVFS